MHDLEVRSNGAIVFNGMIVGEFDDTVDTVALNAGWCRLAGLGIKVEGDSHDRRRVLLERHPGDFKSVPPQEESLPGMDTEKKEIPAKSETVSI